MNRMIIQRRNFLIGLASILTAPAIVRIDNIMPVRSVILTEADPWVWFQSWPIGTPIPETCVEGYDLLSAARTVCAMSGNIPYIKTDVGNMMATR